MHLGSDRAWLDNKRELNTTVFFKEKDGLRKKRYVNWNKHNQDGVKMEKKKVEKYR